MYMSVLNLGTIGRC